MSNFESFSEDLIPRIVPQPTLHPVLDMSKPIVPEVSLLFDDSNRFASNKEEQPQNYKEWKQQQQRKQTPQQLQPSPPQPPPPQQEIYQKMTSNQVLPLIDRKKIVTFDLPIETQTVKNVPSQPVQSAPMAVCQQLDLSLCEPRTNNQIHSNLVGEQSKQPNYNVFVQNQYEKRMTIPESGNQHFNGKHKRLSAPPQLPSVPLPLMNQAPQSVNQMSNEMRNQTSNDANQITLNEIYRLLHDMHVNGQTKAAVPNTQNDLNRMQMPMPNFPTENHQIDYQPLVPSRLPPSPPISHTVNAEPTMRDMFNVILKQQEQLINIQNQVQTMLMRSVGTPSNQIEANHFNNNNSNQHINNHIMNTPNYHGQQMDEHTKQLGVMTSFEINVQNYHRPPANQSDENFNTPIVKKALAKSQSAKKCGCACNCHEQRQMQTSDSGSNEDNFDTSPARDEEASPGWTFYGNILNQVNDVLQNTSPVATNKENLNPPIAANIENRYNATTMTNEAPYRRQSNVMPNIRTAQFKQVGFQIDDVNISAMSKRITFGASPNEMSRTPADHRMPSNENSMLMNALAMKYLPCDLNNTSSPQSSRNGVIHATATNTRSAPTTPLNPIPNSRPIRFDNKHSNTDMSITSYRYMEKYGLL